VAQTKRKRRRKHRGTQGGRVDTRPRGRPRNRAEARQRAQSRGGRSKGGRGRGAAGARTISPPSWRSAAFKAVPIAALFFGLIVFAFKEPVGPSAGLAAFMLLFYIPMAYYTDRFMYSRQLRKQAEERAGGGESK
jgi:hypothetical protein